MAITNITTFGAVGDGVTDNTQAIAEAIQACSLQGAERFISQLGRM